MSSTLSAAEVAGRGDHGTILVLLVNRENRHLMCELLTLAEYGVIECLPSQDQRDTGASDVDLCIVDGPSLARHWEDLRTVQAEQDPIPLPVLLLTDRDDVGLLTRNLWRIVDDVVHRPVDKLELRARIETLMRSRRLALQVQRLSGLYEHERRVAQRFQEAALPRALPDVAGLRFSAVYRPANDEARVGGDWYDAAQLPDGRVVISIGDVCGFGLNAAVTMANVRQVIRGVAQIHPDPAMMLDAADRALKSEDADRLVTAFVGVYDPVTAILTYASAGHPRPLLRRADGSVSELVAFGVPLGLPVRVEPRAAGSVELPKNALLVLYTDGVTESGHDLLAGEARLRAAVSDARLADTHDAAALLYAEVVPRHANDDVAILAIRTVDEPAAEARRRWSLDANDVAAAYAARSTVVAGLSDHGIIEADVYAAETVFGELIGNLVRHAHGSAEIIFDWTGAAPVLHVLDRGPGFRHVPRLPADVLSERGRGLFIISSLAAEFHVTERPDGGSHARAVLLARTRS